MSNSSGKVLENVFDSKKQDSPVHISEYTRGDEAAVTNVLSESFDANVGDRKVWAWKHIERPGFKTEQIITARVDNEVVACFHCTKLPIKLEENMVVPFSFDGDFAVLPEYRGRDIAMQIHDYTDQRLYDAGVVLRGGFTSEALNKRFYNKQFGYVFAKTATANYRKIIGVNLFREKILALGEKLLKNNELKRSFRRSPALINFEIEDFPPFYLDLSHEAFLLTEGLHEQASLHFKMPYNILNAMTQGAKPLFFALCAAFISGEFRIRKFRGIRRSLMHLFWVALRSR